MPMVDPKRNRYRTDHVMRHIQIVHNRRKRIFASVRAPIFARLRVVTGQVPPHDHDYMEVVIIGDGRGLHRTMRAATRLRTGDVIILRPRVWHGYTDCSRLGIANCCFGAELLENELAWFRADPLLNHVFLSGPLAPDRHGILMFHLAPPHLKRCLQELRNLRNVLERQSALSRAVPLGHLATFLGRLASGFTIGRQDRKERLFSIHPTVQNAIHLIEQDPASAWTLGGLSTRLSNIAASYLVRLFRVYTGLPPMKFIARYRAERAATLLLHTDRPVKEIGTEVGWDDPNHFARRFKKIFACSPTEYRSRFQGREKQLINRVGLRVRRRASATRLLVDKRIPG